jgi:acetyl-CoA synthetase
VAQHQDSSHPSNPSNTAAAAFLAARDFLLAHREDLAAACRGFRWPVLERFNWALDYFDPLTRDNHRTALWLLDGEGRETRISFADMAARSNRAARFLRRVGWRRGDRALVMLPNVSALWELTLAAMKLGVVVSPATTLLAPADLEDRIRRGGMRHVIADAASAEKVEAAAGGCTRVAVGEAPPGWQAYAAAAGSERGEEGEHGEGGDESDFEPDAPTLATDPFLLYFTSGTTAKPKMVLHSHQSYPVGHLSTMYWLGLRPGDVHLNISSPGWAKHAWSSFFAPWNAAATIFIPPQGPFDARRALEAIVRCEVSSLCASPTVWRLLVLEDLAAYRTKLRELASAGEPLNPDVIARVRAAWGLTIRDGYGQTETTCQIGNSPGQPVKLGAMGRPLPGYRIALVDDQGNESDEGEIALDLASRPLALMDGYLDGAAAGTPTDNDALGGAYYRTSDMAMRDEDGYYWYVGRTDDVFKSSDYRISPFELESALIEHEAIAEAAVVPSPDPIRLSVPKAYVVLKPGRLPGRDAARSVFAFSRRRLAPYARIRRLEFAELPKTVSGKIRRVELRAQELERRALDLRGEHEHWEADFTEAELA